MKDEKVEAGKYVAYSYKLYNEADGALLFETPEGAPDMMVYGVSQEIVPGLTVALKGLKAGDRFGVTLPPEAAFGPRFDENVMTLPQDIFMRDGKLAEEVKPGAELPMMTAEGFKVLGRVLQISPEGVEMDFNHPFAGLTVRYDGVVEEVREATPEELHPVSGCGGGCGGGGCCGDKGGKDCGSSKGGCCCS